MYTDFQGALDALLNKEKIRRDDWNLGIFITLNDHGQIIDDAGTPCDLAIYNSREIKKQLTTPWEVLPTVEELLIIKGKTYDIGTFCNNFSKVCENCPVYAECNAVKGKDYFVDMLTSEDFKDDEWFRRHMDNINEMWRVLNDDEEMD